jgi:hypothetical protein
LAAKAHDYTIRSTKPTTSTTLFPIYVLLYHITMDIPKHFDPQEGQHQGTKRKQCRIKPN